MNKKRLFTKSVIAFAVTMASQQAVAAGFQLNAQSATGLGRAFAGDAVIADNASAMARNPAAMSLFDRPALSLGINAVDTDINVKNTEFGAGPFVNDVDDASVGGVSYVPNIYYIHPINDKFTVGASIYSNFGTKTEFDSGYGQDQALPDFIPGVGGLTPDVYGGLTDVKSVNFGLSGSYRINQQWSVGAGLDIIYGSGKLQRGRGLNAGNDPSNPDLLNVDADGVGFGFNVGTVYELNENHRFGLSYRYSPELEVDGDMYYSQSTTGNPNISGDKLKIALPDMAEFSGYHRVHQQFAVHYSVQWIGWSSFANLETTGGDVLNNYEWQDGWHYALGGTYYLNNDWTLRAGYMYDTSAQDKVTSISVPDSDRQWFSGGFTYHLDSKSNIDVGVTYLVGEDIEVEEGIISATTRADAWLYGIQYSRSF
ncbi:aromatic hydrocarbon degradation protein [Photobacterium sanctipauli]|uniref:Aromatic hydrocarbon degradation protein n=1 Tax=Photobacterium sanctipauli TaxID=1342794 RepID=A0A2T3NRC0_9GAMM|nr:outer membrane protein transport protein [Photobacterium sanctipauli]PSW18833.1 aromatic hydrocarbon degradation protein [Photobacterium sanctipauli]